LIFNKNIDEIKRIKTKLFEKFDMKIWENFLFVLSYSQVEGINYDKTKDQMKRMINLGQVGYIGTKALK
jgi:hypothetical protein